DGRGGPGAAAMDRELPRRGSGRGARAAGPVSGGQTRRRVRGERAGLPVRHHQLRLQRRQLELRGLSRRAAREWQPLRRRGGRRRWWWFAEAAVPPDRHALVVSGVVLVQLSGGGPVV